MLQAQPHLFPDARAATAALAAHVAAWTGYLKFEVIPVRTDPAKAYDGFNVRAANFDGAFVGYLGEPAAASDEPVASVTFSVADVEDLFDGTDEDAAIWFDKHRALIENRLAEDGNRIIEDLLRHDGVFFDPYAERK